MAVKLIQHGIYLTVPLPIEFVKKHHLTNRHHVTVLAENQWLRIRPLSRAQQLSQFDSEEPLRPENSLQDSDEPPRETPSTIGFFSTRSKK